LLDIDRLKLLLEDDVLDGELKLDGLELETLLEVLDSLDRLLDDWLEDDDDDVDEL